MTDDKIAEIRKRHEAGAPGTLPIAALAQAYADRDFLLAKVERQARHIEELREKIDADRSCACSFDAPGDVCAAHSPALMQARAEVERLTRELNEARAALKASSCAYPDCVDLGPDGKCTKWLLGKCDPTLEAKP